MIQMNQPRQIIAQFEPVPSTQALAVRCSVDVPVRGVLSTSPLRESYAMASAQLFHKSVGDRDDVVERTGREEATG